MNQSKMKKYLSVYLTFAMILALGFSFVSKTNAATKYNYDLKKMNIFEISINNNNEVSLNSEANLNGLEKKFNHDRKDIKSDHTNMKLRLVNLEAISEDPANPTSFEADGKIIIAGVEHKICPTGKLSAMRDENNNLVLIGLLQGYLDNKESDENLCNFAVHFAPDVDKCLINLTIGTVTDGSCTSQLTFGEKYDGFKHVVKKLMNKNGEQSAKNNKEIVAKKSGLMSGGTGTPAPDDPILKASPSYNDYSLFTSLSFQNKSHPQLVNQVVAKMSMNFPRARTYIKNYVDTNLYSPLVFSTSARLWIKAQNSSYQSTGEPDPGDSETSVTIPIIPIYFGSIFGWQVQSYTFTVASTSVVKENSTRDTKWSFSNWGGLGGQSMGGSRPLETTTTDPTTAAAETKGIAAKAFYSYLAGATSNVTNTVNSYAYIDLTYSNVAGNIVYYTMSGLASSSMTIVPANNPY